jgi:hypothetical protein
VPFNAEDSVAEEGLAGMPDPSEGESTTYGMTAGEVGRYFLEQIGLKEGATVKKIYSVAKCDGIKVLKRWGSELYEDAIGEATAVDIGPGADESLMQDNDIGKNLDEYDFNDGFLARDDEEIEEQPVVSKRNRSKRRLIMDDDDEHKPTKKSRKCKKKKSYSIHSAFDFDDDKDEPEYNPDSSDDDDDDVQVDPGCDEKEVVEEEHEYDGTLEKYPVASGTGGDRLAGTRPITARQQNDWRTRSKVDGFHKPWEVITHMSMPVAKLGTPQQIAQLGPGRLKDQMNFPNVVHTVGCYTEQQVNGDGANSHGTVLDTPEMHLLAPTQAAADLIMNAIKPRKKHGVPQCKIVVHPSWTAYRNAFRSSDESSKKKSEKNKKSPEEQAKKDAEKAKKDAERAKKKAERALEKAKKKASKKNKHVLG